MHSYCPTIVTVVPEGSVVLYSEGLYFSICFARITFVAVGIEISLTLLQATLRNSITGFCTINV